jgi:predicted dehydrogenase
MRLRAGVIGLGVGTQHALAFQEHTEVDLVAVCDLDSAKLATARATWPGIRTYDRAEDLRAAEDIGVVAIASFDHDHAIQILLALQSGKHVFAEKPLCRTQEELSAIASALHRNPQLRLSSNTILRRSPRFVAVKQLIEDDTLGEMFYVEADYVYGRLHKLTEGWRGRSPGYSVMLGGGVHMVDLLLWFTGGRVVEVTAYGNDIAGRAAKSPFVGPDFTVALLRFENGLIGKVSANFGSVHPHYHRLLLYGTKATFENRLGPAELWTSRDANQPPTLLDIPYPGMRKGDLIPSFIDAILGRREPLVDEADVFATMQVCLAIDKSAGQKSPVGVPPPVQFRRTHPSTSEKTPV